MATPEPGVIGAEGGRNVASPWRGSARAVPRGSNTLSWHVTRMEFGVHLPLISFMGEQRSLDDLLDR